MGLQLNSPAVTGAAVRNDPPVPDDYGQVVRVLGTLPVSTPASTTSTIATIPSSIVEVLLLAANPNRTGFSIRNTSTMDTLYVKASAAGPAASPVFHTVALVPGAYYEDPFHYVGPVYGVWAAAATGAALVDEYA